MMHAAVRAAPALFLPMCAKAVGTVRRAGFVGELCAGGVGTTW